EMAIGNACSRGHHPGRHRYRSLIADRVAAEGGRKNLVLPDDAQHATERRAAHAFGKEERDDKERHRYAEREKRAAEARYDEAVGTAGKGRRVEHGEPEYLGCSERDECPVVLRKPLRRQD